MARTVAALNRLLDAVSLISGDRRIQIVFTIDEDHPAIFEAGTRARLDGLAPRVVSWPDARKTRFDLILSASENDGLSDLDGPVLLLPHGLAFQKFYPDSDVVAGLAPGLPAGVTAALTHPAQRRSTAGRTAVLGDPAWARMLASRHRRGAYRAALGVTGRRLVVLASTWGPDSLLGAAPDLPELLAGQLPMDEYRLVAVLHPGIWAEHGPWQVRAWLSGAASAGMRVVEPDGAWQAALLAADCVVADHGSLGGYATLAGIPLLLGPRPGRTTVPGSVADRLGSLCARLDPCGDLRAQIDTAVRDHRPDRQRQALTEVMAGPGTARLRTWLYRAMDLAEPPMPAEFPPLSVPPAESYLVAAWVAGVGADQDTVTVTRFPAIGEVHEELPYRHVVARIEHATLSQVAGAAVLGVDTVTDEDLFTLWPQAVLVTSVRDGVCRVWTRGGAEVALHADDPAVDPWVLASVAYRWVRRGESLTGTARLRAGQRLVTVRSASGR